MPSSEDAAKLQAYFEGVAETRRELETRWGVGRAEILAGDDLRARWAGQCARWSAAYQAAWDAPYLTLQLLADVQNLAAAMRRGYGALDANAEHLGHRPIAPWVWEVLVPGGPDLEGTVAAIVQTNAEASKVIAEGRYLVVYTLAEIGNVLAALPDALRLAKQVFPGSRFRAPPVADTLGAGPWRPEGDEIPFGDVALLRAPAAEVGDPSNPDEWA
jgi:hypothetical protein